MCIAVEWRGAGWCCLRNGNWRCQLSWKNRKKNRRSLSNHAGETMKTNGHRQSRGSALFIVMLLAENRRVLLVENLSVIDGQQQKRLTD